MTFDLKRNIRDMDECWASYLELVAACTVTLIAKRVYLFCNKNHTYTIN
jgi:hypothetical protein